MSHRPGSQRSRPSHYTTSRQQALDNPHYPANSMLLLFNVHREVMSQASADFQKFVPDGLCDVGLPKIQSYKTAVDHHVESDEAPSVFAQSPVGYSSRCLSIVSLSATPSSSSPFSYPPSTSQSPNPMFPSLPRPSPPRAPQATAMPSSPPSPISVAPQPGD